MDFKQIEAFVAVAKNKSFSKAADSIFLSQPTVSTHIASLENELNISLFDRNGKEVNLTPAGEVFLEYAINMINVRNNALINISTFNNNVSGILPIASSTTPCRFIVPSLIKPFIDEHSNVMFDIKEGSTKDVFNMIISNHCDIGFVGEKPEDKHLGFEKIAEDNLILISNRNDLPYYVSLNNLLSIPFILREKGSATRNVFEKYLESKGLSIHKFNIVAETSSVEAILQFVKNKVGLSIVSESSCTDYLKSGIIKKHMIKDFDIVRDIFIVYYKNRTLSPASKAFYSFVINSQNKNVR